MKGRDKIFDDNRLIMIIKSLHLIIGWGFCDIQNSQGRGRGYQPKLKAQSDNPYRDLDYSGYHENLIQLFIIWQAPWLFPRKFHFPLMCLMRALDLRITLTSLSELFISR